MPACLYTYTHTYFWLSWKLSEVFGHLDVAMVWWSDNVLITCIDVTPELCPDVSQLLMWVSECMKSIWMLFTCLMSVQTGVWTSKKCLARYPNIWQESGWIFLSPWGTADVRTYMYTYFNRCPNVHLVFGWMSRHLMSVWIGLPVSGKYLDNGCQTVNCQVLIVCMFKVYIIVKLTVSRNVNSTVNWRVNSTLHPNLLSAVHFSLLTVFQLKCWLNYQPNWQL